MASQFAAKAEPVRRAKLEEVEQDDSHRPAFLLSRTELKLLGIAGVGFFLDAYDLFVINPVATMLQYRLYGGHSLPANLEGFVKAGANIGSVIGQFTFGYLADAVGRKAVYGKELMLIIIATILCLTTPTGTLSPNSCLIYLGVFRILLGIGVGGDYPMSASVTSDRANLRKRGTMLAYIFSNQGWGSFTGSLIFLIVLQCYRHVMETKGEVSKVDGIWRIVVGMSLIPAFGTLYQRLTLPESTRYQESQRVPDEEYFAEDEKKKKAEGVTVQERPVTMSPIRSGSSSDASENATAVHTEPPADPTADEKGQGAKGTAVEKKRQFAEFVRYFSEWRHFKVLLGTCMCWFLLDIAFYGINLNQNVVLQQIGFDGKTGSTAWEKLDRLAIGNIIITSLGFVPGYYATVLTIEYLGRWKIQFFGFLMEALFLGIMAGRFHQLSKAAFIVNFAFLQFFFNFGANSTTYIYPAEVFPTRFKAFAHGLSAACGKAGAIISALAFNSLSHKIGTPSVLWIFFGCCIAGAVFTLLLPEVRMRDPDVVYEEEEREKRRLKRQSA
ncbi:hypothetical protein FRB90_010834 [Tulasnella sp. 427]|nr:hypothetical protein FRB90_010834 [Tulasnella sp. 427]